MAFLPQSVPRSLNALGVEVGATSSTTQDHKAVLVAARPCDGSQTLLCYTQEVVLRLRSADRINCDSQASICSVLEANRERETRRKLTVQLRFCCACSDGAERDEVCKELWGDCVEHLRCNGHALGCKVDVQLARDAKTLVDLEALINVGIVDKPLPADCCPRLLEVGTHDDAEPVLKLIGERLQTLAVLNSCLWVVDGARSDHDQQAVILLCDDLRGFLAALDDGLFGMFWDGELVGEELGRDQGVVSEDWEGQLALVILYRANWGMYRVRRR